MDLLLALARADGQPWASIVGGTEHTAEYMYGAQADAVLAWLDDLLGGDEMRERVAEAIRARVWGDDTADDWSGEADAALAVVRAMVGIDTTGGHG